MQSIVFNKKGQIGLVCGLNSVCNLPDSDFFYDGKQRYKHLGEIKYKDLNTTNLLSIFIEKNKRINNHENSHIFLKWFDPDDIQQLLLDDRTNDVFKTLSTEMGQLSNNILSVNKSKVSLILFDLGEVIYTGKALSKIAKQHGLEIGKFISAFKKYEKDGFEGKRSANEIWRDLTRELNFRSKTKNFSEYFVSLLKPIEGMISLSQKLSSSYNIGIVSNIYEGYITYLKKRGLSPIVDEKYSYLSCEIRISKPSPKIFAYISKRSRIKPESLLLIDDKLENIVSARIYGWQAYHFNPKHTKVFRNLLRLLLL